MLEEHDIKKIGEVIEEKVGFIVEAKVGPMIEAKLKASEDRIILAVGEMIEQNVLSLIVNLPDKAYLDDKLADLEGATVVRQRKEDQKVNLLIEFLQKKQVLGVQEVRQLNEFQVFPSPPAVA